jgi:hypothetical protein
MYVVPIFLGGGAMVKFNSLSDCFSCYGRNNLVPIDNLKQIIFYTKNGCQPKFIWENENKDGKITCWYLKGETNDIYNKWQNSKPRKNQKDEKESRETV